MTAPLVTCLMPVWNTREDWLRIALNGAAAQTYPNLDLIVCDNGSTKASTVNCIKEMAEKYPDRIKVVRVDEPKGSAYALDGALKAADQDTVFFTKNDSDDIFHKDREKNRVKLFQTLPPQIGLIYDNFFQLIYHPRPHLDAVVLRPYDYRALLESSYIHGNSMWRASVYERWGGPLKETFVYDGYDNPKGCNFHGEDYALWLRITDHFDGFWFDCDPSFAWTYRVYSDSKYHRDRRGVDYCRAFLQHAAKERRGLL